MTEGAHRVVVVAKMAALVLMLAFAPLAWAQEIRGSLALLTLVTRFGRMPAVYSCVILLSFAGLIVTPFLRHNAIRTVLVAMFTAAFAIDRIVFSLSGSHANTDVVRTLWQGRMFAGAAFRAFHWTIIQHLAAVGALAVALAWPFPLGLRAAYAVLPIGALVLVTIHAGAWPQVVGYPSPLAVPARFVKLLADQTTTRDVPLAPVPGGHLTPSAFRKIVFILDESVRGDYVSINNGGIDTTPFLEHSPQPLINFGIVTSASNCSYQSRWMLRQGLRRWQLPEEPGVLRQGSRKTVDGPRSTLWQFAQAAGFKTTYIDTWNSLYGPFRDGMLAEELTFLDERVGLDAEPQERRDLEAARYLRSMLTRGDRTFVQLDKLGAHLPYDEFSPPDFNRYTRPDGGRFMYSRKAPGDVVGSYKNTIAWTVDRFFQELLPGIDLRDTLILYTSDHGENLGDGGYAWGHCSTKGVHPSEVWVPLFVFAGVPSFNRALSASAVQSFSEATHFEIFPTLLIAMGYDDAWVRSVYGPSLLDVPRGRPHTFLVGDIQFPQPRTWMPATPWVPSAETNRR